jgi:hypothetical protein
MKNSTDTDLVEDLVEAVNCFGVFIVYILLDCLKPIKGAKRKELEDFRPFWIRKAISPEGMLILFRNKLGLLGTVSSNKRRTERAFKELNKEQYYKLVHYLQDKYPYIFNKINEEIDNTHNMIKPKKTL